MQDVAYRKLQTTMNQTGNHLRENEVRCTRLVQSGAVRADVLLGCWGGCAAFSLIYDSCPLMGDNCYPLFI